MLLIYNGEMSMEVLDSLAQPEAIKQTHLCRRQWNLKKHTSNGIGTVLNGGRLLIYFFK